VAGRVREALSEPGYPAARFADVVEHSVAPITLFGHV
jgi:hypothetical protein